MFDKNDASNGEKGFAKASFESRRSGKLEERRIWRMDFSRPVLGPPLGGGPSDTLQDSIGATLFA